MLGDRPQRQGRQKTQSTYDQGGEEYDSGKQKSVVLQHRRRLRQPRLSGELPGKGESQNPKPEASAQHSRDCRAVVERRIRGQSREGLAVVAERGRERIKDRGESVRPLVRSQSGEAGRRPSRSCKNRREPAAVRTRRSRSAFAGPCPGGPGPAVLDGSRPGAQVSLRSGRGRSSSPWGPIRSVPWARGRGSCTHLSASPNLARRSSRCGRSRPWRS